MEQAFLDLGDKVQINVRYLKPNTVLNCPTYDSNGNEVQPPYTPFTQAEIDNLLATNVEKIFYSKPKNTDNVIYQRNLKEYLAKNVYQGPRTIQVETQQKAVNVVDSIVQQMKNHSEIDFSDTSNVIDDIASDLKNSNQEIVNLIDIQTFDDYTYSHALNVGVIAMAFGRKIGLPEDVIKQIGLGGFLHDIGKIRLPYDLLHKNGPLNEQEKKLMQNHPRYGYEMLKDSTQLSDTVKRIVLLHHEKFDGTGYPFGFKDEQIEDPIRVVAIAEVYDTLTTKLSYRDPVSGKEALKAILKGAGTHFKPDIAHNFTNNMSFLFKESGFYHIGSHVLLNTKEIGVVVAKDSDITSRPELEIIKNPQGADLPKPLHVNLMLDASRHIVRIVPPPDAAVLVE